MTNQVIGIVSTNRNKYSETFIHSHLLHLSAKVLYLFDGYLPKRYSMDKLKTEELIPLKKSFWQKPLEVEDAITDLLLKEKVQLVLAEYGPSGVEMVDICNKVGIPLLVHFHGYDAYRQDVLSTYGNKYNYLFKHASSIIAVSKNMVNQLVKLGCPAHKIAFIPYGIDSVNFIQAAGVKNQSQLVSCGRFVSKKAPQLTIQAFQQVLKKNPAAQLVMIGDGELLDDCKQLAAHLQIQSNIYFTGPLSPNQVAKIFAESSIFLQHSVVDENNDSEGLPLSILEAGAAGLPIVSTLHAGIPDVVETGKHGFLVAERDVDQMAEKILFLLDHPAEAEQMGKNLQTKILEFYTMERYINDLKNLIQQNT